MLPLLLQLGCYDAFTLYSVSSDEIVINLTSSGSQFCVLDFGVAVLAILDTPTPQIMQFQRAIYTQYDDIQLRFTCNDTAATYQAICQQLLQDKAIDFRDSRIVLRQIDGRQDLIDCGCRKTTDKVIIVTVCIVSIIVIAAIIVLVVLKCKKTKFEFQPVQQSSQLINVDDFSGDSDDSLSLLKHEKAMGNGSF